MTGHGMHRCRNLTDEEKKGVAAAYSAGEKVRWIAQEYDISSAAVSKIARKAGLPRRRIKGLPQEPHAA